MEHLGEYFDFQSVFTRGRAGEAESRCERGPNDDGHNMLFISRIILNCF